MNKYKVENRTIGGKVYEYVYCKRCGVWIPKEKFNLETGTHDSCDEYYETKESRDRATKKVCDLINRLVR